MTQPSSTARATPATRASSVVPGIALALGIAILANAIAPYIGAVVLRWQGLDPSTTASPISAILVAVLMGLLIRNTVGVPEIFRPGVAFAMKMILRLGIVLLGIRLSFLDALRIGIWGIPVVAITVLTGIVATRWIGRLLHQPHRLGTLIAASTAICGISAVIATAPVIGARDREITYAVATVTVFGMVAMMCYPYLAFWLFAGDAVRAGLFMGTAIHDTAQVTGAGLIYSQLFDQPVALDVATVTKLLRNIFLVAVVPVLALMYTNQEAEVTREAAAAARPRFAQLFPTFVLGFLAMALLRSLGDAGVAGAGGAGRALGLFTPETWQAIIRYSSQSASVYLLGTAMAGVGLNTPATVLRELGGRPLVVGFLSALVVGSAAAMLAFSFGGKIGF